MFSNKQRRSNDPPAEIISKYLNPKTITFLQSDNRERALRELVGLIESTQKLDDGGAFLQAIYDREKIVTTGIGMGVAIPHAKLPLFDTFFIAIGIHPKGLEWHAIDGMPVRLVFMIGGPDDKQTEYLQLLSHLTLAIKDEERRKKMLQLSHPKDIMALFKGL